MHKTDIIRKVAKETRLSQRVVSDALNETLAVITQALREGQTVVVPGFGTFYTKERRPSRVRNIHTGETMDIPAMRQADFRVGELLRQAVRRGTGPHRSRRPAADDE